MSISRRQFIQGSLAAGMAGAAGVLGSGSAMAARHNPLNEAQADFYKKFDRNVVLLPSKYGGYVQALDLAVPETLAWYNYGLAGVNMPIPHHIAAMPSADPYKGFDFYQTMQPPGTPYVNENSPNGAIVAISRCSRCATTVVASKTT